MTQDSGDAFGPGATRAGALPEPADAVSALRVTPPIASAFGLLAIDVASRLVGFCEGVRIGLSYSDDETAKRAVVALDAATEGATARIAYLLGHYASAIEARRAETRSGSVHESAAPEGGDAP